MAVQYIDTIQQHVVAANNVRLDMETPEVHSAVSSLYGMTYSSRGRESVVRVVTMGHHADNIIALTRHSSEDGKKDMKKSAIRGFASDILLMVIRSTDNVEFLQKYATQLITIGSSDSHSKLSELVGWTAPLTDPVVFTEAGIGHLVDLVRSKVELSEEQQKQQQTKSETLLSSDLVTTVRLLQHQVCPAGSAAAAGQLGQHRTKSRQVITVAGNDGLRMDASFELVQQIKKLFNTWRLANFSVLTFQEYYKLTLFYSIESVIKRHIGNRILCTLYKAPELFHQREYLKINLHLRKSNFHFLFQGSVGYKIL